ncbi:MULTISPECIES: methyltransferase domain-containing protein [Psychrilyobacter]|uniref:Methyltransferase domain-containing protein n=1 Tax=Psychrilyobacter piezotolerans TaxID=2293438 RepID=A0ABX9KJG3_9FUSO|nr:MULTISPECIES: methyltransferase domain-containing protein [Psychrilyobacter]MCS5421808.1 methyltransferase [Psychrilyobacter sp. S5]NDI77040.1 methyltransferase domain-containing protein [Psychrilyobacter piezotolerans]RDE64657.1 methyltransferase domain-containing protein [Psychrilyobacter sp. S5]REI42469.1 methyltransferase domain-containing protein [Psychrilyobacter piezotolerans]
MNFDKKFDRYEENAHIQKIVAKKLINLVPKKKYRTIFEIGAGTGVLTKNIIKNIEYKDLIVNDKYFESKEYIKDLPSVEFIGGDIEKLEIGKADLIISSSVFQWIEDKDKLFEKISNASDTLVFSIYIKGNLMEISDHFGISLEYLDMKELKILLSPYFKNISGYEEEFKLAFDTPMEGLKHLKNTGVTGIGQTNMEKIRNYSARELTYKVGYFICEK